MPPRAALVVICLLASSCRRAPPTQETTASTASAPRPASASLPATSPQAAASASAPASGASSRPMPPPSGSAPQPLTPEEQATARKYLAALGRGRSLTTKQQFPAAIVAFDEALRLLPGDARALAERGYARLQASDLDGAERDFYATLARTPDQAVLSATTFNLATVAERRGKPEQASELREAARTHHVPRPPSGSCQAEITRGTKVSGPGEAKKLQTLRQVRTELTTHAKDYGQTIDPPLPTTSEEANLLLDMLGGGAGPWKLMTADSTHLLFGKPLAYTLIVEAMAPRGFRCGSTTRQRLDMSVHPMTSSLTQDYGYRAYCQKNPSAGPDEPAETCSYGCGGPLTYRQDFVVYDRATGDPLMGITSTLGAARDETPLDPISVVVREDGVQLLGNGCNAFEPFARP